MTKHISHQIYSGGWTKQWSCLPSPSSASWHKGLGRRPELPMAKQFWSALGVFVCLSFWGLVLHLATLTGQRATRIGLSLPPGAGIIQVPPVMDSFSTWVLGVQFSGSQWMGPRKQVSKWHFSVVSVHSSCPEFVPNIPQWQTVTLRYKPSKPFPFQVVFGHVFTQQQKFKPGLVSGHMPLIPTLCRQ